MKVYPYLNFAGNTEEAFTFYKSVLGGEFFGVLRFRHFATVGPMAGLPDEDLDKVMHMAMPLGKDGMLMGTDLLESLGQKLVVGNNVHLNLVADSAEEAKRIFDGLSDGGKVTMPLAETEWAEAYGMLTDRYGVQWMINYEGKNKFTLPQN